MRPLAPGTPLRLRRCRKAGADPARQVGATPRPCALLAPRLPLLPLLVQPGVDVGGLEEDPAPYLRRRWPAAARSHAADRLFGDAEIGGEIADGEQARLVNGAGLHRGSGSGRGFRKLPHRVADVVHHREHPVHAVEHLALPALVVSALSLSRVHGAEPMARSFVHPRRCRGRTVAAVTDGVQAAVAANIVDDRFLVLVRKVAPQVAKGKPPPSGASFWSDEDYEDLVMDMVERVEMSSIVLAANKAANDKEFEGWICRALRTELHLRARGTPRGWVIERVDEALSEDEAFVRTADGWALAGGERSGAWDGNRTRLIDAAWSVETRTIRQDPEAQKVQLAWRDDTRAVCKAVLAASGPIAKVVLGEIVAQRFSASFESSASYLDLDTPRGEEGGEVPPTTMRDSAHRDLLDENAARWMLSQFSEEELIELRAVIKGNGSLRGIGTQMGFGKHKAEALRERIKAKLRVLGELADDDDLHASAVVLRMIGQADELLDSHQDDEHAHR